MASIGLTTGLKALLAAQASLDTIGHNISNSTTPGYSRQRVQTSASRALLQRGNLVGSGVTAESVVRTSDALLLDRMIKQISSVNRLDSALGGMTEVEALLGEPGELGLNAGLTEFFGAMSELSTSTGESVLRNGMVQKTTAMTTQFNQLSSTMTSIRRDTANQVKFQTQQVNVLSNELVLLNKQISATEASGNPANDLRDQREERLRILSTFIDTQYYEDPQGVMRVTTGGRLLIGGASSFDMNSVVDKDGSVNLFIEGSDVPVELKNGKIAGLVQVSETFIPELQEKMDNLANNLIFEMNKAHSTGTPAEGLFQSLSANYRVSDHDGDGSGADELLSQAGLPFEIQEGVVYVSVQHRTTGELNSHKLEIDPLATTVEDLVEGLNEIDGLNASLDNFDRLQIFADAGFGFDFATRLNGVPDNDGTLGSDRASFGAGQQEPYVLTDGSTINLTGPVSTFDVTFNTADFEEISEATASEMAAVLNANPDMQANGFRAVVTDDRLYLQTAATGTASTLTMNSGSALAALSIPAGTVAIGSSTAVDIKVGGSYTGEANNHYVFTPKSDGTIGTTPGLEVDVFNATGQLVATLDVGDNYQPGTVLEVAEGVTVSFGFGELSATANDLARLDLIADSDTSNVLAAMGINALLVGTGAAEINLRDELSSDPSLIAAGGSGASGDNTAMLRMLDVQSMTLDSLGGGTIGDFYGDVVSGVGFELSQASSTREVGEFLLQNLETRREETSGVNVDEELVNMVRFEESFNVASRFIQVLNELSDEIMNLI